MSFFGSFLTAKVRDLHDSSIKLVAKWDPEAVGEAQIIEWDNTAKEMATSAAKAATAAKAANDAVVNINSNVTRYTAAAEKLAATNEVAANKAADQALEWAAKLDDAQNEANEANSWSSETLEVAQNAERLVMEGRKKIEAAKRDLARATQQQVVADQRLHERERMAGLKSGLSGADIAINAISANAIAAKEKVAAANIRSGVLGKAVEADALINQALQEVDNGPKPQSLADKLAALKK